MDNSATIALKKIITAFGEVPKNLTRIQVFAKVARLANDIDERRIYPDISEAKRKEVLDDLKRYFLFYRAEDYLIHQPFFYPRALLYWALRKFQPDDSKQKITSDNIDTFTKQVSKVPGYTNIFNACLDELSKHPNEYHPTTMHELMSNLSSASTIKVPTLRSLFRFITGYTRNETVCLMSKLSRFAHEHDSQDVAAAIEKTYKPSVGPDTAEEFFFCLSILINYSQNPKTPRTFTFNAMMESFSKLINFSRSLCSDIPTKNLHDQLRSLPNSPNILLALARVDYSLAETYALAMGRYYLERHKDKLSGSDAIILNEALADLYISSFIHAQATMADMGIPTSSDEEMEMLIQRMLHETWANWDRPSVQQMIEHIDRNLSGKNASKFHSIIQRSAPYFDLHVTYYTEQNEVVRRLRRNIFKHGSLGGENESYRSAFLKTLAENHSEDLAAAGFDEQQIRLIQRAGKLPDKSATGSTWNVDHIIDIHAGGTNKPENLCLMPAELNEMKNLFLLLQTNPHSKESSGFWVLTLRPKAGEDGKPSPILLPQKEAKTHTNITQINGPA